MKINGQYLIEYSLHALAKANFTDVVINLFHLGHQIKMALGHVERYGLKIHYSEENSLLGTGGGIINALPWLGNDPFLVLSADVITNYPLENLPKKLSTLAHLVLVDNPDYHPLGDFYLENKLIAQTGHQKLTFSSIGIYHPLLFKQWKVPEALTTILLPAIKNRQISGEYFNGQWANIGTQKEIELFLKKSNYSPRNQKHGERSDFG